jgi:hypothetical protein
MFVLTVIGSLICQLSVNYNFFIVCTPNSVATVSSSFEVQWLLQVFINPKHQVTWETKYCTMAPETFVLLV